MKKKLFSLAVTLVMALSLAVPAMAADITISNPVQGQDYDIYQIFDLTVNEDGSSYSYTIPSNSPWLGTVQAFASNEANGLTVTAIAGDTSKLNIVVDSSEFNESKAAEFAVALNTALKNGTVVAIPVATADVENGYEATGLESGYYFVDSSMGALCALYSTDASQEVREKNQEPTVDKEVKDAGKADSIAIGDTVPFEITVTAGGAADTTYVVHDTMSDGLTLNQDSFKVTVDGEPVSAENYELDYTGSFEDGCTFEITFDAEYTATLEANTKIVIEYTAVVNENASTGEIDPETNEVILDYGESSDTTEEATKVYTYEFDVVKTDAAGALLGDETIGYAQFKLYAQETGGEAISLIYDQDKQGYRPTMEDEPAAKTLVATDGQFRVFGLAEGEYWLEEVAAPDGYNLLTDRQKVDLTVGNVNWNDADGNNVWADSEGGIHIVNQSGVVLPGTGGMGTTIFYVVGGTLVVAAAVLLITKKRMHNAED